MPAIAISSQSSRRLGVTPLVFKRLAVVSLVAFCFVIVTGGAVRLTGSGLGCPDWPSCYDNGLTAQLSFHPMVEFVNRCITVLVTVAAAVTFLAALVRVPRRRDLIWLSGGLVVGIIGQIVLGGLVVLFHLNPYLVMAHFLFSMAIVVDAVVLVHRAGIGDDLIKVPPRPLVGPELVWLTRILVVVLALVVSIGTSVTGSGPHAGDPNAGVRRIPVAFRDIAELHSTIALFLIGMTLATLFAFHQARAPERVMRGARLLLEVMVVQGVLGYTQYFLHDNPLVVGFHIAGATLLVVLVVSLYLQLFEREPPVVEGSAPGESEVARSPAPAELASLP